MAAERPERHGVNGRLILWAGVVAVALGVVGVWVVGVRGDAAVTGTPAPVFVSTAATSASVEVSTQASQSEMTITTTQSVSTPDAATSLSLSIAELNVSGTVSVAAIDLTDGDRLTAGTGTYETASIVKVDILVALLVQRNGSLTATQKSLATRMITVSDNTAASSLFAAVGSASGLNATNKALGLVETTAGTNGNWGLTRTTAADQIRLLRLVYEPSTVLSPASQAYVQSLMGAVDDDQDWGISVVDDDATGYGIKNGWLPRSTTGLWDVTSIGSVQSQGHQLLIVVLVNKAKSMAGGISTIETAAAEAAQRVLAV